MGATSLEELNCPARLAGEWLIPVLPNEESLKKISLVQLLQQLARGYKPI